MKDGYDVIIIGGGITGAGTARDCAMRGLKVLLIERNDIATGATGRNHGLLHSGARYAVTDRESAAECIRENLILKRIARNCVEDTSGLFISLPEDDLAYQATFVQSCLAAGIDARIIDPKEALTMEPSVNPELTGAVVVPDGSVDPFRLCLANVIDAKARGAEVLVYHEVVDVLQENGRVIGVRVLDKVHGEVKDCYGSVTVNAGGIWGHHIASLAGVNVGMFPAKGALLIFAHRVAKLVLNRCRKPANADILVPGDTVSIIGTTSTRIPYEECDDVRVTPDEVDLLLREGALLSPSLSSTRILRAYAGVRPLVASGDDPTGRSISRGIVCIDHEVRDGLKDFITITGGKLMTYRLMAEQATDAVCARLGISARCTTAEVPLPGSEIGGLEETARKIWEVPTTVQKAAVGRAGSRASQIELDSDEGQGIICECEEVSYGEIASAVDHLDVRTLTDLRRRTRFGMGTCQGELCGFRAAGVLAMKTGNASSARKDLRDFMNERWKGMFPIAWGETLREAAFTQWVSKEVLGLEDNGI